MVEINMQMPEKCGLCPCFHFDNPMYCQAVKADKNKKIVNPYGSPRPEWCPLKEQEQKRVLQDLTCETRPFHFVRKGYCPRCHHEILWTLNRVYCGFCGQKVKWNDYSTND